MTRRIWILAAVLATALSLAAPALAAAPTVKFVPPSPPDQVVTSAASLDYHFSVQGGSTDKCWVDDQTPGPCTSTTNHVVDTRGLAETTHVITVRATNDPDPATTASRTFVVDRTPPELRVSRPTEGSYLAATSISAEYTASDVHGATVDCALDGGAYGTCTGISAPEGDHTLVVRAQDSAVPDHNTAQVTRHFSTDVTPPSIILQGGPTDYAIAVADASPVSVRCALDGAALAPCTTSTTYSVGPQPPGRHSVRVVAVDAAGNSSIASADFVVPEAPRGPGRSLRVLRCPRQASLARLHGRLALRVIGPTGRLVTLSLVRSRRTVARERIIARGRPQRLRFRLPAGLSPGRYSVQIRYGKRRSTCGVTLRP